MLPKGFGHLPLGALLGPCLDLLDDAESLTCGLLSRIDRMKMHPSPRTALMSIKNDRPEAIKMAMKVSPNHAIGG